MGVFFHLLWITQFLIYFNYLVLASITGRWYFSVFDEGTGKKLDLEPHVVLHACERTSRFHLGSVALGSFIIAVVHFIQACVAYIKEKCEGDENQLKKAVLCCLSCCLYCLECCLDKLSQNSYAWIAVYGDSFCHGACSSTSLLLANIVRTAAMAWVEGVLLFAGKVFVSFSTACIGAT